jgi:hypothetical protein
MNGGVPAALRWLGALAGMLLVVAIALPMAVDAIIRSVEIDDAGRAPVILPEEEEDLEEDLLPQEPVEAGAAAPIHDFSGRDAVVRQADNPSVAIGEVEGDAVYVVFAPVPGSPACVGEALLELELLEATPTELGAYPADVPGAAELSSGDELPDSPFLTPEPLALAVTDGTPGRLLWDVTNLYVRWAEGEFGDQEHFVVAIRPPAYDDPDLEVRFASIEADADDAGLLTWTGLPDCP